MQNESVSTGPVVVVGCAQSGVRVFREAILACDQITWIDAPRLVHLGRQISGLWSRVDARVGSSSSVQRTAIGSLLTSMVIGRLASSGTRSWAVATEPAPCEGLEFFAGLFTKARFICLHRRCDAVALSAVRARPWGISGAGASLDAFATRHPWNQAAALAEYWEAQTRALLAFEAAQPDRCLRVRLEDVSEDQAGVESEILRFTGLPLTLRTDPDDAGPGAFPPDQLPEGLLSQVNELIEELGYDKIARLWASRSDALRRRGCAT
jgi:Sulfotransferase family